MAAMRAEPSGSFPGRGVERPSSGSSPGLTAGESTASTHRAGSAQEEGGEAPRREGRPDDGERDEIQDVHRETEIELAEPDRSNHLDGLGERGDLDHGLQPPRRELAQRWWRLCLAGDSTI